jgi:hypothetical protein
MFHLSVRKYAIVLAIYAPALPYSILAQEVTSQNEDAVRSPLAARAPSPVNDTVRILYTGKLLGYFRDPDGQPPDALGGCPNHDDQRASLAAREFDGLVEEQELQRAILVGMGDNFAPEVEARKFCRPPAEQHKIDASPFDRSGKEYFVWDGKGWRTNEYVSAKSDEARALEEKLREGDGFIKEDNVARFFVSRGYAAMVPGKHDFYYGAERLRELAGLLASSKSHNNSTFHLDGVQMLGSNLVIETAWKNGHELLSDHKQPPWFIPRFPTARDLVQRSESKIEFSGLSEGGTVYPWFQGPHFSIVEADPLNPDHSIENAVARLNFTLCKLGEGGDPKAYPDPTDCHTLNSVPDALDPLKYLVRFSWVAGATWETLEPGMNYIFCAEGPVSDPKLVDKKGGHHFCLSFSTYVPLFQYSSTNTGTCHRLDRECKVPRPYVLLPEDDGLAQDVAIFGAIDPHLPDYVGLLNLSWSNTNSKYKTVASVKEPAEALKEMDDYFEQKYKDDHGNNPFTGVKVLLAQMSPQAAEILAARVGKYQVVISEADAERATYDHVTSLDWNPSGAAKKISTKFVAVPEPFYDESRGKQDPSPWNVDIGSLTIQSATFGSGNWHFLSEHFPRAVSYDTISPAKFRNSVETHLNQHCLSKHATPGKPNEQMQWLTLCVMQDVAEADIAFLQKRDFFPTIAAEPHNLEARETPKYEYQDLIDRILWKGDFLVVSHIPGSIIQKVMAQSKAYNAEDSSSLSLSDETKRGLVAVGIHYDEEQAEYVVNGVPLDPNKLYSVVTSDFVTGGDTGYPDLAAAQAHPPGGPHDLDRKLQKVSGVVCGQLTDPRECLGSITRNDYFDEIEAGPINTRSVKTNTKELKRWSVFFPPGPVPGDTSRLKRQQERSTSEGADTHVEQRPLWDFALNKWTLGITALGHNDSDFDVQNNFGGVSAPGVNAVRTSTWASDMQAQYTRNWQHNQILLIPAYTFNTQYKGQPDDVRQINQQTDLGMFDIAGVHLWPGRGAEHFDSIVSVHFETPLASIFNAYTLVTTHLGAHGEPVKDQLRFAQDRSYTALIRPGIRWMRRKSSMEFGPEIGHEWDALDGFTFTTGALLTTCLATATVSISQCVKSAAKANPASFSPTTEVTGLRSGHNHAGMYWKFSLTVPFHPRVSYVFTDTGDWFFVHYSSDNSTDTRFRDTEQHQLKFTIFPSLSIGPEVDLLLYQNSSTAQLPGHFLRQDTVMMKAHFNFDLFNGRKLWQELQYAPPPTPK